MALLLALAAFVILGLVVALALVYDDARTERRAHSAALRALNKLTVERALPASPPATARRTTVHGFAPPPPEPPKDESGDRPATPPPEPPQLERPTMSVARTLENFFKSHPAPPDVDDEVTLARIAAANDDSLSPTGPWLRPDVARVLAELLAAAGARGLDTAHCGSPSCARGGDPDLECLCGCSSCSRRSSYVSEAIRRCLAAEEGGDPPSKA